VGVFQVYNCVNRVRSAMFFRTFIFLITMTLMGCQAGCHYSSTAMVRRKAPVLDEPHFATILDYYRKTFPVATFASGESIKLRDGPAGERIHVNVPGPLNKYYQHRYGSAFLSNKSTNADGLTRMIATDLLLLRKERLFTYPSRVGYGGEVLVDCITYVVKGDRSK
jgi:hypothetical protein